MALNVGDSLGPYAVTAKIGEGGMGEVYRARDTKLDRDVALKVLPEAFTSDPDRLARFEREAKVLASLNHPNIGHIYGLEEAEGQKALVLELIEGPTLADRIAQGPIPIDEALPIAKQIAEALEAAHEAGVIHRDLKPANIKVREDGTVKVLDFGLAKAVLGGSSGSDPSQSPTVTAAATASGVILGTAAYMSPEQARGKPVDKRSDIWSFGCVLYETLTGRVAFRGETLSDTVVQILDREPDWTALPAGTPPVADRLLRRCLNKDSRKRLRDIGDARVELDEALAAPAGAESASVSESLGAGSVGSVPTLQRRALPWVAAGAAVVAAGLAGWVLRSVPVPAAPDAFAVTLPEGTSLSGRIPAALSPDGRTLVYIGGRDGVTRLYRRPMDQVDALPIADTDGARAPFFSPDGEWVCFTVGSALMRVRLAGGTAETVCIFPVPGGFSAGWSEDDTIWFGSNRPDRCRVGEPFCMQRIAVTSRGRCPARGIP